MMVESYAQWAEDIYLARALSQVAGGFYIDVGANDPDFGSATKYFYIRGWRGINIEPSPDWFELITSARPRDINIQGAVSNVAGSATFYDEPGGQLGTLVEEIADQHARDGRRRRTFSVRTMTLTQICEKHAPRDIHFLKIDVGGYEGKVLEGMDFSRFRPWVVVLVARRPMRAGVETYQEWEPYVLDSGYVFTYTDAINRYYVAKEHSDLSSRFSNPAVDYIRAGHVRSLSEVRETLRFLQPHAALENRKKRFGAANDGGYVMLDDFRWIDTALSIGSLKAVPWELAVSEEPIKFFMLGSAPTDIERLVEEHDRRNTQPNIVLHTDLGGETWSFFDAASRESLQRFAQIVCELHNLESLADTWWYRKIRRVFEKFADDYAVVHLHANNAGGTASIHGIVLPRVLQVSFANRQTYSFVPTDELFPGELDLPCDPSQPDLWLGSFRF